MFSSAIRHGRVGIMGMLILCFVFIVGGGSPGLAMVRECFPCNECAKSVTGAAQWECEFSNIFTRGNY